MAITIPAQIGAFATAASIALLTGACMAGNAPPPTQRAVASGRQCFLPYQVNGFHPINRDTVLVTVGARTTYALDLLGTCSDIDWSERIGIRSTGGGSWVCEGLDAEVFVPSPTGLQRCPVLGVRRLTPEEAQAMRNRH